MGDEPFIIEYHVCCRDTEQVASGETGGVYRCTYVHLDGQRCASYVGGRLLPEPWYAARHISRAAVDNHLRSSHAGT